MKSAYVRDLQPNQMVTATFLVHSKELRQKKSGDPYLSLSIGDRTGDIDAKMWDNVGEVADTFESDDFIRIKGLYNIYQNRPQITIHKLQRVEESEVEPGDYFPVSQRDPEEMFSELLGIVRGFGNPHLKALLEALLADEEIARRFKRAPAAKMIHHAYLGGLLEHVLSLCHLCRVAADHYKTVDADLLLTGAVLHDLGKIHELNYERGFSYSTEGQLLGHIFIGLRMVEEKLAGIADFPPKLRALVEHMILSHHGQLEFGSPKVPLFPEAMLLHYLDDLDSKMECMRSLIENDRQVDGDWTGYSHSLDRTLLKKLRYLEGAQTTEAPELVPSAQPEAAAPVRKGRLEKQATLFGEKLKSALGGEEP